MKNLLLFALTIFVLNGSSLAQNDIVLNINHKLGNDDFALNSEATNNLGHSFKLTRLQYYISEISIIHDGGIETPMEEKYILIKNGSVPTTVDLGNYDIVEVEAVSFHIGVDSAHNHLDPATYPSSHPLAPQNPSMHWGWIGGYRFLALEGIGGDNFDQVINLHSLGDENYFKTQINLNATAENNIITINVDADYTRAVENIALDAEMILHGEYGEAKLALENFRDYVFTASNSTTSVAKLSENTSINLFPNPTMNGISSLQIKTVDDLTFDLNVFTILGKHVQSLTGIRSNSTIELHLKNPGLYIINLEKDGQVIQSEKLITQ